MLIDTHAHLTDERYGGAREIIDNMTADGLERIITVGYDMESSSECKRIAESNAAIYFDAGVHPSDSQRLTSDPADELVALCADPKCVAVGEIGLDYHYDDTDRKTQIYWLERQLEVVDQTGLPVCFHVRDAYEDFETVIRRNLGKLKGGAVLHCYSGSKETAEKFVDLGFYVSFSGSVTFSNAKKFYDIVPVVPRDKILIETDCPYLAPVPYRGKTNYPRYVRKQAEKIAEILDEDYAAIERLTTDNAYRIFPKMQRA